jgi:hypothetical protein
MWARESKTLEEIGVRFNISHVRVHQILFKNKELIKIDKEYEKLKRLSILKRMLSKHSDTIGKKDTLDIVDAMRIETEGNKNESNSTPSEKIVIIFHPDYKRSEIGDQSSVIPKQIFR